MQLKTKPKGSINRVGVIEAPDNRRLKYRAIWRENGKQRSKGFETLDEAIKFRASIEIELIDDYKTCLKNELNDLFDDEKTGENNMEVNDNTILHAMKIIDDSYQHKFDFMEETLKDGTQVVHLDGLDHLDINEFENAAYTLLRHCVSLESKCRDLQKRIDITVRTIDELLHYDDFSDTTGAAFGNVPEELKFYLSGCDTLAEYRSKVEKKGK